MNAKPDLPGGTVTFLFTDIEGSTQLLGWLRESYKELLADHHRIIREVVDQWGGREVSTEGDAFFVSFPKATEAVAAAVEIQRTLAEESWPGGVQVKVRMGLHTGEPWILDQDYAGLDVHRAARIAHVGHGGQVLLSETTTALVRDELPKEVALLDLGRHQLKDMRRPERIHQLVIAGLPSEFPPLKSQAFIAPPTLPGQEAGQLPAFLEDGGERQQALFVGRERELHWLRELIDPVLNGEEGRPILFITGDPGSGKSALLQAVARRAGDVHPDLLVAYGACNAFSGVGDAYLPFRDALNMLTGDLEDAWRAGTVTTQQASSVWKALPDTARALLDQGSALLDTLLPAQALLSRLGTALSPGSPVLAQLRAQIGGHRAAGTELEQDQLFEQVTQTLRAISQKRPLLIAMDDLQWIDQASVNLLFHLARRLGGSRILILGAYRPEEVSLGREGQRHPLEKVVAESRRTFGQVILDLNQASTHEEQAFVDALLDAEPNALGDDFHQALLAHTGGHPLFTVETLRYLQGRGDLVRDDQGRWLEGPELSWGALPERLEGVIAERIGRLEEKLREILSVAAVEGERFTAQVVARVQELQERGLLRTLSRELEKRHKLVQEGEARQVGRQLLSRYRFSHAIIQRYLYKDLSAGERRLLHGEVGEILEELYAGREDEIAVQLARHFAEAGRDEKAVGYMILAADEARDVFAYREAIDHYQGAVAILEDRDDRELAAGVYMKLAQIYHTVFSYQEASQAYERAFDLKRRASPGQPSAALPTAPHPLRLPFWEPITLDPGLATDIFSGNVIEQLFSGLLELTPELEIMPDVAYRWEIDPDGHRYLFHLRDDVFWSDGRPVTAADFEFAWKRALDPGTGSPLARNLYDIAGARAYHQGKAAGSETIGVQAVDDVTLEVDLDQPAGYFLQIVAGSTLYPVPRHTVVLHSRDWAKPEYIVTNGPFRLAGWEQGRKLTLERNPRYHGHFPGNTQEIELHFLDPQSTKARYESGQIDICYWRDLPETERQRLIDQHPQEFRLLSFRGTGYLEFDHRRPPFDNPRVRQAFVHCLDKNEIARSLRVEQMEAAGGGMVPPGMPGHSDGLELAYDPEKARQLLAESGYPGGRDFPPVTAHVGFGLPRLYAYIEKQWRSVLSVEIDWRKMDWQERLVHAKPDQLMPNILEALWVADYPDPDNFLRAAKWPKRTGWRNSEYERLIAEARRLLDQEKRMSLYRQAEKIMIEQAAVFPLTYMRDQLFIKPWVRHYRDSPLSIAHWKDVIIEPH